MKYLITLVVLVVMTLKIIFGAVETVEHIEKTHQDIVEVSLTLNQTEGVF